MTTWAGGAEQYRLYREGRRILVLPIAATDEGGDTGFILATPRERKGAGGAKGEKIELVHVVTDRAGC
jgi:hypothetical protein